jgi:hypothetical protein
LYNALSGYRILLCKQVGLIIFYAFRGNSNALEAAQCYERAADVLQQEREWSLAGNEFCEAASVYLEAGTKLVAATNYVRAARCYSKDDDFHDGEICCCWLLLLC